MRPHCKFTFHVSKHFDLTIASSGYGSGQKNQSQIQGTANSKYSQRAKTMDKRAYLYDSS